MWRSLYPNWPEDAAPIDHVTNGVHAPSWPAPQMCRLYNRYLGVGWRLNADRMAIDYTEKCYIPAVEGRRARFGRSAKGDFAIEPVRLGQGWGTQSILELRGRPLST